MISIITPVYNGERFIEFCIKNVIDQNCPNVEHLIIDGGSTDRTVEIIKRYAEKYPHIRWVSEKDSGQSDAMNKGIALAKGEILGNLNVDDFYEPGVLNRVSGIFKTLPEPSLLVGNCKVWNDAGNLRYIDKPAKLRLLDLLQGALHPVNPSAYFYHTSLHRKIGIYKVDEHYAADLDFILKAVQKAKVKYVDEIWGNYRYLENTKTAQDMQAGRSKRRRQQILETYRRGLPRFQKMQLFIEEEFYKNRQRVKYYINSPQNLLPALKAKFLSLFGLMPQA
ncbi:glycosyltransferase [bacterium]|nr:glycosyltransferase [bacterium]